MCKSKTLFQVTGVVLLSTEVSYSPAAWGSEIHGQFSGKWRCHDLQGKMNILDVVLRHEGNGVPFRDDDLAAALNKIKRKSRTDHYGISVLALRVLALSCSGLIER